MRIDLQYSPTMAKPAIHRKIRKCKHQEQIFVVDQMPKVDARSWFTVGSVSSILRSWWELMPPTDVSG
jgi:hypothetical protein